jgi:L-amino acid N-acyltransferase YncA
MPIVVRLADPSRDAAAVAAIYAPAVADGYASFELVPPDAATMAERMRVALERLPWLVAADGGEVIGYAYAGPHRERAGYRWAVNISVYVAPGHQGRGVGRALYDRLLELLRRQRFVNAYAGITLPNPPSIALHEAIGMTRVALYPAVGYKHGRWHDVAWYGMRLLEPEDPPAEPIPIGDLAGG